MKTKELRQLVALFRRNGCIRLQKFDRLLEEGYNQYKKGDEIRFVARSPEELALIRSLLERAGFRPGKPCPKGRQIVQPVYGRANVDLFLEMLRSFPEHP